MTSIQKRQNGAPARAQTADDDARERARLVLSELRRPSVRESMETLTPVSLRSTLTPQRVERLLLTAMQRQPQLLTCTPLSLVKATLDLLALGLDPSGVLGDGYLVPFWNSRDRCMEAQGIPGYRGLVSIARRTGQIESINAQIVYENDKFAIDLAGSELPKHRPGLPSRGEPVALYCIARFVGGGHHTEYMTVDEINAIRERSNGYQQAVRKGHNRNPWITDWGQMARKTIIRRACHYWPMSVELSDAFALDDKHDRVVDGGTLDVSSVTDAPEPASAAPAVAELPESPQEPASVEVDTQPPVPRESAPEPRRRGRARKPQQDQAPATEPAPDIEAWSDEKILEETLALHERMTGPGGPLTPAQWAQWVEGVIQVRRPRTREHVEALAAAVDAAPVGND